MNKKIKMTIRFKDGTVDVIDAFPGWTAALRYLQGHDKTDIVDVDIRCSKVPA